MSGADSPKSGDRSNKSSNNGYHGPEDMTAESMYAGLVSIFVVAVILFIGISISLAGSSKCCRKRCKCCRRSRDDDDDDEGHSNAAFVDSPPSYDEVMRRDTMLGASQGVHPADIFTITSTPVGCRPRSGSSGGSTTVLCAPLPSVGDNTGGTETRVGSPPLARQNTRRSLRAMLGSPPNYFEVLRNWTNSKILATRTGAQSENWKSSTPPPKYSDVEKQMEEERQQRRRNNGGDGNHGSNDRSDPDHDHGNDSPA